jgi:colicin import membrane protein
MNTQDKNSFYASLAVHGVLFLTLTISSFFEKPQLIQVAGNGGMGKEKKVEKPIIQAGLIDKKAVKTAVARQEQQERDKQQQLAKQQANAEKIKKEAENLKLATQKLKQEVAAQQKKAAQEKQLAIAAKAEAEKAKLQIAKEREKVLLEKKQVAKKLAAAKQAAAKAKTLELAKQKTEAANQANLAAKQAEQAAADRANAAATAVAAEQAAARNRWIDSEFTKYVGELQQRVYNHRTLSSAFGPELVCKIQIKLLPEGSVHDVRIIQSSGNAAYDSMAEAAVYKAAPFTMPEDRDLVAKMRDIILEFTNEVNG